ncbi:MAG TPA: hypothetical protein VL652_34900 [Kutzneria sp.]|jgi:hypothetical protein|nr:hypothetical protein [Kutzneria sp.]
MAEYDGGYDTARIGGAEADRLARMRRQAKARRYFADRSLGQPDPRGWLREMLAALGLDDPPPDTCRRCGEPGTSLCPPCGEVLRGARTRVAVRERYGPLAALEAEAQPGRRRGRSA